MEPEVTGRRQSSLVVFATECRTVWPAQSQTRQSQDVFEVSKQHLDLLAMVTGALEGRRASQSSGYIARILIQIARDPTPRRVGTAARLEFTALTVGLPGPVEPDAILSDA